MTDLDMLRGCRCALGADPMSEQRLPDCTEAGPVGQSRASRPTGHVWRPRRGGRYGRSEERPPRRRLGPLIPASGTPISGWVVPWHRIRLEDGRMKSRTQGVIIDPSNPANQLFVAEGGRLIGGRRHRLGDDSARSQGSHGCDRGLSAYWRRLARNETTRASFTGRPALVHGDHRPDSSAGSRHDGPGRHPREAPWPKRRPCCRPSFRVAGRNDAHAGHNGKVPMKRMQRRQPGPAQHAHATTLSTHIWHIGAPQYLQPSTNSTK